MTVITEFRCVRLCARISCIALLLASAPAKEDPAKHYALIFGTAYGPDDRPLYGAKVTIHPVGKKHPSWELSSDHRGEFAQRVPPGPGDYLVEGRAVIAPLVNGIPDTHKKKQLKAQVRVHIDKEERRDIGLHLAE